jgi:hypothetical protein
MRVTVVAIVKATGASVKAFRNRQYEPGAQAPLLTDARSDKLGEN